MEVKTTTTGYNKGVMPGLVGNLKNANDFPLYAYAKLGIQFSIWQ